MLFPQVYVTLKASQGWKNINKTAAPSNSVSDGVSNDVISVITVPANSGATVSFPIIPIKLGNIPVEISAQSTTSADAVRRNLLVEVSNHVCFQCSLLSFFFTHRKSQLASSPASAFKYRDWIKILAASLRVRFCDEWTFLTSYVTVMH